MKITEKAIVQTMCGPLDEFDIADLLSDDGLTVDVDGTEVVVWFRRSDATWVAWEGSTIDLDGYEHEGDWSEIAAVDGDDVLLATLSVAELATWLREAGAAGDNQLANLIRCWLTS